MSSKLSSLLFSLCLAAVAFGPARAAAQVRVVGALETDGALPLASPTTERFGFGGAGAGTIALSFDETLAASFRVEGGFLSDGPPPGAHQVDPGVGSWGMTTLGLRLRPLGDLFHEGRRTTGLFVEAGAGVAVTGGRAQPGLSGSLGWGFAVGDVVLAPTVGVSHLVTWDAPLDGVGAVIGHVGLALILGDTPPPVAVPEEAPIGDRDGDGIVDPDDFCPDEPEDHDTFLDDDGCPDVDDDEDGIHDVDDACPRVPEDFDGDRDDDGCPEDPHVVDRDHDGIVDVADACPDEPEVINGVRDHDGCPDEGLIVLAGNSVVLDERVLFDFNRARVLSSARPVLASVVAMFRDHPEWDRVRIEGHTDERGEDEFNMELSERRAIAVEHVLVSMGLPADRIEVVPLGETRLRDDGTSEEAHARNRRVELVMIDDGETRPAPSTDAPVTEPETETTIARAEGDLR